MLLGDKPTPNQLHTCNICGAVGANLATAMVDWKTKPLAAHSEYERQQEANRARIEQENREAAHRKLRKMGMTDEEITAAEADGYIFRVNLDDLIARYECRQCNARKGKACDAWALIHKLADLGRLIEKVDRTICLEAE